MSLFGTNMALSETNYLILNDLFAYPILIPLQSSCEQYIKPIHFRVECYRIMATFCFFSAVLPPEIGQLTSLTQLWLIDLQLDTLPSDIGNLTRLQKLSVRSNHLLFLPNTFADLVSLQWLHLAENCLTELPYRFGTLKHLAFLNLDSNRFTVIPECLGTLPSLTTLSMRNNRIRQLPDKLVLAFSRLSKLDLRDTEIENSPERWKVV